MTKEKRAFVQSYIDQLKSFDEELSLTVDQGIYYENEFYELIRQVESIFKSQIPTIGDNLMYRTNCAQTDANTLAGILQLYLLNDNDYKEDATETPRVNSDTPIIFLSHKSSDKKYGDALRNFLIGLGVRKEQLIYTSHPLHKIPLDANIFDYLRNNINRKVFMIILWS